MQLHFILVSVMVIGCANVPAEDDPRRSSEFAEDGSCSGLSRDCSDRPTNACSGGCELATGCGSPYVASCAALTTATACDSNGACRWSSTFNQCTPSDICDIWDTPGECDSASDPCIWGQVCKGYADSCYEYETSATCSAQGCRWEADF